MTGQARDDDEEEDIFNGRGISHTCAVQFSAHERERDDISSLPTPETKVNGVNTEMLGHLIIIVIP